MSLFRILAFTLCVVLLYALYLPSAYPPERFVEQIRTEHGLNAAFWGEERAHQLLQRSLALYAHQSEVVPAAFASSPGAEVNDTNAVVVTAGGRPGAEEVSVWDPHHDGGCSLCRAKTLNGAGAVMRWRFRLRTRARTS